MKRLELKAMKVSKNQLSDTGEFYLGIAILGIIAVRKTTRKST